MAPESAEHTFKPASFTLKAPIYDPQKVIAVGMNYVDHCTEQNIPVPEKPIIFSKFPSAITEPNGPVIHPEETDVRWQKRKEGWSGGREREEEEEEEGWW